MTNVELITSNVGSLFEDKSGTIKVAWTNVVTSHLKLRGPDFVAIGFQELGGKAKKMEDLHSISTYLIESFCALGYDSHGIVLESNPASPEFSATGVLYLWKPHLEGQVWNQKLKVFESLQHFKSEQSRLEVSSSPYCTHGKFEGNSRKGFISARFKLEGRELDLITTHNFHDDDNRLSVQSSVYRERRARALRHLLKSCDVSPERAAFLFGDLNNRLEIVNFLAWIRDYYRCSEEEVQLSERKFTFPEQQELFEDWHTQHTYVRRFDTEPFEFNLEQEKNGECILFEPEICFPMTFPLLEDSSGFAPTRPPAWCDRLFCTKAAIELLGKVGEEENRFRVQLTTAGSEYNIIAGDVKDQGDHKQVFLSFRLPQLDSQQVAQ